MQNETITIPTGETIRLMTADEINRLALELGQLGNLLVDTGVSMVRKAIELGGALTAKKAEMDRNYPGTWTAWCADNLAFSERHALRYRNLYADRTRVSEALAAGHVTSLRTAIALIGCDSEEGGAETVEMKSYGAAPVDPSKLGRVMAKFWSVFHRLPPAKWGERERSEFLIDLAERERIRRDNGWKTIDVEAETLS